MDVFHGDLKSIKTSCLRDLNFCAEVLGKVFIDDSIRCSKKCQHIFNEMFFIIIQFFPISLILKLKNWKIYLREVNFFSSPKRSHLLLIHIPHFLVLNWQNDESTWILGQNRLRFQNLFSFDLFLKDFLSSF